MYILNSELRADWNLPPTVEVNNLSDLTVRIQKPNSDVYFLLGGINPEDYVAPTSTKSGRATARFTPDTVGVWKIMLCSGPDNLNENFGSYTVRVIVPDTDIKKLVIGS